MRLYPALGAAVLPPGEWTDVRLEATFVNDGDHEVVVYPGAAVPSFVGGAPGPTWTWTVSTAGAWAGELRTWYGPPGSLPAAAYYEPHRVAVPPGERRTHTQAACWLPSATLAPAEALDLSSPPAPVAIVGRPPAGP